MNNNDGSLLGLWVVQVDNNPIMAKVQDELYALAFTNAPRASAAMTGLGTDGKPFYVLGANHARVVQGLRDAGARGFIVDYDPGRATFAAAHAL